MSNTLKFSDRDLRQKCFDCNMQRNIINMCINNTKNNLRQTDDEIVLRKNTVKDFLIQPTNEAEIEIVDLVFLMCNPNLFLKGGANLLVSAEGIGKTFFSIHVAQSKSVKKTLFILFEDYSGHQLARYQFSLKDSDYFIMTLSKWNEWCEDVRSKIEILLSEKAMNQVIEKSNPLNKFRNDYRRIYNQLLKDHGIKDNEQYNNLLCYMLLIDNLQDEIDLVVVDTFLGFQDGKRFNRQQIKKMICATSEKNITSLWLHHTNAQQEIEGNKELSRAMDYVYILKKIDEDKQTGETILELRNEKYRHSKDSTVLFKRTWKNDVEADHEVVESEDYEPYFQPNSANIASMISDILSQWTEDSISVEQLNDLVSDVRNKNTSRKVIKNALKELEINGEIEKADGQTWNIIRIKKH